VGRVLRAICVLSVCLFAAKSSVQAESLNQIFEKIQPQTAQSSVATPKVPVEAQAVTFDRMGLEKFVKEKLEEHVGGPVDTVIDPNSYNVSACQKFLPAYEIHKLSLNDTQTHFSAEVKVCSDAKAEPILLAGTMEPTLDIPVLNKPIHAGDAIKKEDIKSAKFSSKSLPKGTVRDPEELIGSKPKAGMLKSNVPIKSSELDRAKDVKKGALVNILFKSENMEMQAKGKATEAGMVGDSIKVLNVDSNKTIKATIIGTNQVSLTPDFDDTQDGEIE